MGFRDEPLTPENQASFDRYYAGKPGAKADRIRMLASQWVKTKLVDTSTDKGYSANCYASGTHLYKRRDGQPITQDDIEAVENNSLGQVNSVKQVDELTIQRYWVCDSSG